MVLTTPATTGSVTHTFHLDRAATAMVWRGAGIPHEAMAVPSVTLAGGEVLVEVELATICGSDLHTVRGDRASPAPSVLGHEQVGRVVAVGAGVPAGADGIPLEIDDRVVWSITVSCGRCDRCERGLTQKCRTLAKYGHERIAPRWELNGGFATHVHLRAGTAIVRVPRDVPAELLAPVSCGTATAWAALAQAQRAVDLDGATVLISGAGLIGLTATAMATDRGATVIVADPDAGRRSLARRFGAVATIDPGSGADAVRAALAGLGGPDEPDVVLEASGASGAVASGIAAVGTGGIVVLVGSVSPSAPVPVDAERIVRGLITVRGVHNYAVADLSAAAAFITSRGSAYPFIELVGGTVPLDRVDAGITRSGAGGPIRVGVEPRS